MLGLGVEAGVLVEAVQEDTLLELPLLLVLHMVVIEYTLLLLVVAVLGATVMAILVQTPQLKACSQHKAVDMGQMYTMGVMVVQEVVVDMLAPVDQQPKRDQKWDMMAVMDTTLQPDTPEGVAVEQVKTVVTQEHLVRHHLMT